jgi:hypothetical protein
MKTASPLCACGQESRWVENILDKGYYYCGDCKLEVVLSSQVSNDTPAELPLARVDHVWTFQGDRLRCYYCNVPADDAGSEADHSCRGMPVW